MNLKQVYRLMKLSRLLLSSTVSQDIMTHTGQIQTLRSNTRWCSDYFTIPCWNGEGFMSLSSLDTCDQEAMRYVASTKGINGKAIRVDGEATNYRLKVLYYS